MLLPEASVENALRALNIFKISLADRLKAVHSLKPDRRGFAAHGFSIKWGPKPFCLTNGPGKYVLTRSAIEPRRWIVYIISDIISFMVDGQTKPLRFLGDSLQQIRDFPEAARKEAGVELHKIQQGLEPNDWKPMTSVGPGVREIRIRDEAGAFRVLYVANIESAIYVLHAFQKKTQQTAKRDLDLAERRLKEI
jgi:phage-related protein